MLGTRKVFGGTSIHASCVLPLQSECTPRDSPLTSHSHVLLGAVGDTVKVFSLARHTDAVQGNSFSSFSSSADEAHDAVGGSGDSPSAVGPCALLGYSFVVGATVVAMAPLRHQVVALCTRDLELIIVRFQANLPPLSAAGSSDLDCCGGGARSAWAPAWHEWLLCARVRLSPLDQLAPATVATAATATATVRAPAKGGGYVLEAPVIACNRSGTLAAVQVYSNVLHSVTIALPTATGVRWSPNAAAALTDGVLNPTPAASSNNSLLALSSRTTAAELGSAEAAALKEAARQRSAADAADVADEDLLPEMTVAELARRKRLAYERAMAREALFEQGRLLACPAQDATGATAATATAPQAPAVMVSGAWLTGKLVPAASDCRRDGGGDCVEFFCYGPQTSARQGASQLDAARAAGVWSRVCLLPGGAPAVRLIPPPHSTDKYGFYRATFALTFPDPPHCFSPTATDVDVRSCLPPAEAAAAVEQRTMMAVFGQTPDGRLFAVTTHLAGALAAETALVATVAAGPMQIVTVVAPPTLPAAAATIAAAVDIADGVVLLLPPPSTGAVAGPYPPRASVELWVVTTEGWLGRLTDPALTGGREAISAARTRAMGQLRLTAVAIDGVPADFATRRITPLIPTATPGGPPAETDYKLTFRYAVLSDDVSDVYVVDLIRRRVVSRLAAPGAMCAAVEGPAGGEDILAVHTRGLVTRLCPAVPVSPAVTVELAAAAVAAPVRCLVPPPPAIASPSGAMAVAPVVLPGVLAAATVPWAGGGASAVVSCDAAGVRVATAAQVVSAHSSATEPPLPLPSLACALPAEATHAAICRRGAAVFVVAALCDGRLALVTNHRPRHEQHKRAEAGAATAFHVAFVTPPRAALAAPVSALGLSCLDSRDSDSNSGSLLAVLVGRWDGGLSVLSLVADSAAPSGWRCDVGPALANPEAAAPAPLQIVAAPPIHGQTVWAVRSASRLISVVTARTIHDGQLEAVWRTVRYCAPTHEANRTGSADEGRSASAAALGSVLVHSSSGDGCGGADGELGSGRSAVLLMDGMFFSLLFLSLPEEHEARSALAAVALVEEELRLTAGPAAAGAGGWLQGCAVVDTAAGGGSLVGARWWLHLASAGVAFACPLPREALGFARRLSVLDAHQLSRLAAAIGDGHNSGNRERTDDHDHEHDQQQRRAAALVGGPPSVELSVRRPPVYTTAATARLSLAPFQRCVAAAYCPRPDILIIAVGHTDATPMAATPASMAMGTSTTSVTTTAAIPAVDALVSFSGATLAPLRRVELPTGCQAACLEAVPHCPSLPGSAGAAAEDLVLIGCGQRYRRRPGSTGEEEEEPALGIFVPGVSDDVAWVPRAFLGLGPGVTAIAVQRRRDRVDFDYTAPSNGKQNGKGEGSGGGRWDAPREEILVAACIGTSVALLRLLGHIPIPVSIVAMPAPALTVSLCYPFMSVGCGEDGNVLLLFQRSDGPARKGKKKKKGDARDDDDAAETDDEDEDEDENEDEDEGEGEGGRNTKATTNKRQRNKPDNKKKTTPRRVLPPGRVGERLQATAVATIVGSEPAMHSATICEAGYRGTQVVRCDEDGGVVFSLLDIPAPETTDTPEKAWLAGTNAAGCTTDIYHCFRLPSPATRVSIVTGGAAPGAHPAAWRRRPRALTWADQRVALRNPSAESDGTSPLRVLLPCLDGGLFLACELPWACSHPLGRLEQCFTDGCQHRLLPLGHGATAGDGLACLAAPFRELHALHGWHRVLPRQGAVSLDALLLLHRLRGSLATEEGVEVGGREGGLPSTATATLAEAATAAPFPLHSSVRGAIADLERALLEDYGGDLTLDDCAEISAAW